MNWLVLIFYQKLTKSKFVQRSYFVSPQVMERLLSMPVDYWNQFINTDDENIRSPPYNPTSHRADGTPLTPECRPGKPTFPPLPSRLPTLPT